MVKAPHVDYIVAIVCTIHMSRYTRLEINKIPHKNRNNSIFFRLFDYFLYKRLCFPHCLDYFQYFLRYFSEKLLSQNGIHTFDLTTKIRKKYDGGDA